MVRSGDGTQKIRPSQIQSIAFDASPDTPRAELSIGGSFRHAALESVSMWDEFTSPVVDSGRGARWSDLLWDREEKSLHSVLSPADGLVSEKRIALSIALPSGKDKIYSFRCNSHAHGAFLPTLISLSTYLHYASPTQSDEIRRYVQDSGFRYIALAFIEQWLSESSWSEHPRLRKRLQSLLTRGMQDYDSPGLSVRVGRMAMRSMDPDLVTGLEWHPLSFDPKYWKKRRGSEDPQEIRPAFEDPPQKRPALFSPSYLLWGKVKRLHPLIKFAIALGSLALPIVPSSIWVAENRDHIRDQFRGWFGVLEPTPERGTRQKDSSTETDANVLKTVLYQPEAHNKKLEESGPIAFTITDLKIPEHQLPRYVDFNSYERSRSERNEEIVLNEGSDCDFFMTSHLYHRSYRHYSSFSYLSLPSVPGYELVSLELTDAEGARLFPRAVEVGEKTHLYGAILKGGSEKVKIRAGYKKHKELAQIPSPSLSPKALVRPTEELRKMGLTILPDQLDQLLREKTNHQQPIDLKELEAIFKRSAIYVKEGDEKIADDEEAFGKFSKYREFVKEGLFHGQCDSTNDLFADFLNELFRAKALPYKAETVDGFLRKPVETTLTTAQLHRHTIVTTLWSSDLPIHLDVTPGLFEADAALEAEVRSPDPSERDWFGELLQIPMVPADRKKRYYELLESDEPLEEGPAAEGEESNLLSLRRERAEIATVEIEKGLEKVLERRKELLENSFLQELPRDLQREFPSTRAIGLSRFLEKLAREEISFEELIEKMKGLYPSLVPDLHPTELIAGDLNELLFEIAQIEQRRFRSLREKVERGEKSHYAPFANDALVQPILKLFEEMYKVKWPDHFIEKTD